MTAGALTVIILIQFVELTGPRPRRLKTERTLENFTKAYNFLSDFAARAKRDRETTDRIRIAGEEMLATLSRPHDSDRPKAERHLLEVARNDGDAVNLEFAAATGDTNLEDRLALLGGRERDHALRLEQPPGRHQIGAS